MHRRCAVLLIAKGKMFTAGPNHSSSLLSREVVQAIRKSWSAETSSDAGAWSANNPAWGQCAVTACLVQDYLGGDIVWSEARLSDGRKVSHYFNLVGRAIDLTLEQFPDGTEIPEGVPKNKGFSSTREYVLSFPQTRERYELLKARVANFLAG